MFVKDSSSIFFPTFIVLDWEDDNFGMLLYLIIQFSASFEITLAWGYLQFKI